MQYRKLGSSSLDVSVLSFGAWQIGDPAYWGEGSREEVQATVDKAIEAGINLFDTAEMYGKGESERVLGAALGSRRKDVLVASKVWPDKCAPAELRRACEGSLKRLGTDAIDLYQVHWPVRDVPIADVYGEMARLREEGKIREIGVSNFGAQDLDNWMKSGACVSNQLGYNLLFRAIEWEVLSACRKHRLGVMVYMPLMQGLLAGRWDDAGNVPPLRRRTRHFSGAREGTRHGEAGCEALTFEAIRQIRQLAEELGQPMANVALAWTMAQSGVTTVIVGGRRPDQLERNLAAADLTLSLDALDCLDRITEPLKRHLGANADMWLSNAESRIR